MLAIAPLGAWPRLEPCIHPRPFPYFKGDVRVTLLLGARLKEKEDQGNGGARRRDAGGEAGEGAMGSGDGGDAGKR